MLLEEPVPHEIFELELVSGSEAEDLAPRRRGRSVVRLVGLARLCLVRLVVVLSLRGGRRMPRAKRGGRDLQAKFPPASRFKAGHWCVVRFAPPPVV